MLPVYGMAQLGGGFSFTSELMPKSAREAGLGGEAGAIGIGEIDMIASNPAMADSSVHNMIAFNLNNYLGDIGAGRMSYAYYLKGIGTLGLTAGYVNYGDMTRRDEFGANNGSFKAGDQSIGLIYSRRLQRGFRVGGNVKSLFSTLDTYQAFALAVDIAGIYEHPNDRFYFTAEINNLGAMLSSYNGQNEQLPLRALVAASYKIDRLPIRLGLTIDHLQQWDLTYQGLNDPAPATDPFTGEVIDPVISLDKMMRHLVMGLEFVPSENFYLQFGYNYRQRQELKFQQRAGLAGVSMGAGLRISRLQFNYAYSRYHLAASSHQFTLGMDLNQFGGRKKIRQEKRVRQEN